MKKIVFLIVTMATLCGAKAQDTVSFWNDMDTSNYYIYGIWPNPKGHYNVVNFIAPENGGETAKCFYTPDSLTVYGIAAAIRQYYGVNSPDTSFEYLRLYNQAGDSLNCINQKEVYLHKNISCYVNFDTVYPPSNNRKIGEMHECYFDTPTTVVDSFYVGTTYFLLIPDNNQCTPLEVISINGSNISNSEYIYTCHYHQDGSRAWYRNRRTNMFAILFPILSPDTLVGIDTHNPLDRLTGVMPNPAAECAKVVSSFGMSRVEVYNLAGRRVHEQRIPDGSLYTNLDVRRWPQGVYIVRIHTPLGVTSKKLTVQR